MQTESAPSPLVVVIDDFVDAADALALLLGDEGFKVQAAYDGQSALSLIEKLQPEAAVIDIAMPDMDGRAVAQALRATSWGSRMHLIALTGLAVSPEDIEVNGFGFDDILIKPIEANDLLRVLRAHRP